MKNKRRNVQMGAAPKLLVGAVVLAAAGALAYLRIDSKCGQMGREIHKQQQAYTVTENEAIHQEKRWKDMQTPENLDRSLLHWGMVMPYPTAAQIVRVRPDGVPVPGQRSLAELTKLHAAAEKLTINK